MFDTKLLDISKKEDLETVCDLLRKGEIVAFPTETVYGLGANALNPDSITKVYEAKGRPSDNPLIVHIAHFEDIPRLVKETTSKEYNLSISIGKKFWPGPLSILFPKSSVVPNKVTGGLDTVVLRMPSHPVAHKILASLGLFFSFFFIFLYFNKN